MTMKKMISLALATCMALALAVPVGAATIDSQDAELSVTLKKVNVNFENESVDKIEHASVKDAIVINGVTNYLYPTFDEVDAALANLEAMIPEYYSLVEQKVDLASAYDTLYTQVDPSDFDVDIEKAVDSNINQMKKAKAMTAAQVETMRENAIEQMNAEKLVFDLFFDIYENKAQNEEIKEYVESTPNPDPETLAYMLPYTAPFSIEYFENNNASLMAAAQTFNITDGTAYAVKWAMKRNTASYPDYSSGNGGGDCANFASQILVAGGIKMHEDTSVSKGWWCKAVGTVNPGPVYTSSLSWRVANNFVKFMGTSGNVFSNFKKFSEKVKAGDFITYNLGEDGDWDHVGYITATGKAGTYPYLDDNGNRKEKTYTNFCVAQHSSDYYAWVNSRDNGWEVIDGGTTQYGIVRRGYSVGS